MLDARGDSSLDVPFACMVRVPLSVVGGNKRRVIMGGGIVCDCAVRLGVAGFATLVALDFWATCSCVRYVCSSSVVDGNNRRVNVGGGIASARDVLLDVPGLSPLVMLHLWAPCSTVLLSD